MTRHDEQPPRTRLGAAIVAGLLIALAGLLIWQTWNGLSHIDMMMADRSETLQRMVSTELRNVARYGKARRTRIDEVLAEVAASSDVIGVSLEGTDGGLRLAHGELPHRRASDELPEKGYQLFDETILRHGPVLIETHSCHSRGAAVRGCPGFEEQHIDGEYVITMAIDAHPYLELRRTVWVHGIAGGLLLLALAFGLLMYGRQNQRSWAMRHALAVADERAQSLERLGRLSAGLAHEIKNPVGSLRGFAQLIAESADDSSKEKEYAELMVGELDAITKRVNSLRELARPTAPVFTEKSPQEIIRHLTTLLGPDLAERRLDLVLDLPDSPILGAELDEERFRELVVNLLINAIEATPQGGRIVLRLQWHNKDDTLVLEVEDQGPGIPQEERERALRPFHSTKQGGMGLGLAIAQQAIEDHGGRLEIDEADGGGALLRARWPRAR